MGLKGRQRLNPLYSRLGTTYYVDATLGSDTNSGKSWNAPWQTKAKVEATVLKPGDNVRFKAGETWQGTPANKSAAAIRCGYSGQPGRPITYGRYGMGADPIFDQCVVYTDWIVHDDPTYKRADASDADYGRQVFQGTVRLIKTTSIANVKATAGSWYGTGNVMYVHTTTGADPNGLAVGYPGEGGYASGFDVYGQHDITVEHLHVTRPKNNGFELMSVDGVSNITLDACTASWTGQRGFRVAGKTSGNISGCIVQNCVAHDTAAEGIWADGLGTIIQDCEVYDAKKDFATKNIGNAVDGCGILVHDHANGAIVRRCYVHDGYNNALLYLEFETDGRPTGCIFDSNRVYNNQAGANQAMTLNGDASCIARNNLIETGAGATVANCVVIGNGAIAQQFYHNTIVTFVGAWPLAVTAGATAVIRNNIIRCTTATWSIFLTAAAGQVLSNNRYSAGALGTTFYAQIAAETYNTANFAHFCTDASEVNSTNGLPGLVSEAEAGDHHLAVGSACIGTGLAGYAEYDRDNVVRSSPPAIGCYEYV